MVAHSLHCLGATACRCLEGDADQPLADAVRTVRLIDDQGVNSDEVPRPLELLLSDTLVEHAVMAWRH